MPSSEIPVMEAHISPCAPCQRVGMAHAGTRLSASPPCQSGILRLVHGELMIDDKKLYPGDYIRAEAGPSIIACGAKRAAGTFLSNKDVIPGFLVASSGYIRASLRAGADAVAKGKQVVRLVNRLQNLGFAVKVIAMTD